MFQVGDRVKVTLKNSFGDVLLERMSSVLAIRRDPVLLRQEYQVQLNEIQTGWVEQHALTKEDANVESQA